MTADPAALIIAAGTFLTATVGAFATVVNLRRTREVRDEVKTYNETTTGGLAAADETRRIEAIPHDERTAKEQRHIEESPGPEPPQGPAR